MSFNLFVYLEYLTRSEFLDLRQEFKWEECGFDEITGSEIFIVEII